MYAITNLPVLSLTLATFRTAELGFLGFVVYTLLQTPFLNGEPSKFGLALSIFFSCLRDPFMI